MALEVHRKAKRLRAMRRRRDSTVFMPKIDRPPVANDRLSSGLPLLCGNLVRATFTAPCP